MAVPYVDATEYAQCGHDLKWKDRFISSKSARKRKRQRQRQTGIKFVSYLCPYCGFYHVGHVSEGVALDA